MMDECTHNAYLWLDQSGVIFCTYCTQAVGQIYDGGGAIMTGSDEARNLIWDIATRLREIHANMSVTIKRASGDEALLVCEQSWIDIGLALVSLEALDRLHQTAGQDIGGPFVPEGVR